MKTWIVVVNRVEAKVFETDGKGHKGDVKFIEKLENPRGRLKSQDINADKPGFSPGVAGHGGTKEKAQSPTDRVSQMFAKRVSEYLEEARHANSFDEVVLIAAPQFLGRLRGMFSGPLKDAVSMEIPKDLGPAITGPDLSDRLWPAPEVRYEI